MFSVRMYRVPIIIVQVQLVNNNINKLEVKENSWAILSQKLLGKIDYQGTTIQLRSQPRSIFGQILTQCPSYVHSYHV